MNNLKNINVILVEPISGGNVGSICRSINNNGITNLSIVNPNKNIDWLEAKKLACNASDQLKNIKIYDSLKNAISKSTIVAGTSARTGFYRDSSVTIDKFSEIGLESAKNHKIALVFGREDKGLKNDELALCTHIIQIPSSKMYPSLNLSHAVHICCYELFKNSNTFTPSKEKCDEASSELKERMFKIWEQMLIDTEFVQQEKLNHMMLGIRRIFNRGKLTKSDTKILMGIARQNLWIANKKKGV